jgi:hypothetical protein
MIKIFPNDAFCFTISPRAKLTPRRIKGLLKAVLFVLGKEDPSLAGKATQALVAGDIGKHAWHITLDRAFTLDEQRAFYRVLVDLLDEKRICKRESVSIGSKVLVPSNNSDGHFSYYSYGGHHSYCHVFRVG